MVVEVLSPTNRLLVEFEVDREVEKDYGYVEKYLKFNGEPTPYKAIVKDGELLAIVSKRYRLIENERIEEICRAIAEKNYLKFSVDKTKTTIHVFLDDFEKGIGVVVQNSVDGSLSLRVDATVYVGGAKSIFKVKSETTQVETKHFGKAEDLVKNLEKIITVILEKAEDFKYFIKELEGLPVTDYMDELEVLNELLPKTYVEPVMKTIKYGNLVFGVQQSLKYVYERIVNAIWLSNAKMKTKVQYFDKLNNLMFAIVGWKDA